MAYINIVVNDSSKKDTYIIVESFRTTQDFIDSYELDCSGTGFFSDGHDKTLTELFNHIMIRYACNNLQCESRFKYEKQKDKGTYQFLKFYFNSDNKNEKVSVW